MKLTLEHYDMKIIIQKEYDDVNIDELKEMLRSLCVAAGYSEELIKEMFGENVK